MDSVKVARLLEPIMPEKVQRWLTSRDVADARLRGLIDKQILWTARKLLGSYENKILLPPPPTNRANGRYALGSVMYDKLRGTAGLSGTELLQHLAVFGRSGAGKTNLVFHLLLQLAREGVPFLFLDWKRTGRHLLPLLDTRTSIYTPGRELAPFLFNPLVPPPGVEASIYVAQVVDVLGDAFTLGDGSRSLLVKNLSRLYEKGDREPTVHDLLAAVRELPATGRVHAWRTSALRALESLELAGIGTQASGSQEQLAESLLQQSTILELDALGAAPKKFLIPMLCLWLYQLKLASSRREKLDMVIVVEEAHHVLYRRAGAFKESLMGTLLRQFRELGVGFIIVDQHPHLISPAALGNTYASVCMNLKDPTDINKAAALSLVEDADKRYFSMLPVGQGITKLQDRWRKPFLVQVPLVDVQKGSVTDEMIRARNRSILTGSGAKGAEKPNPEQVQRVPLGDSVLADDALAFLEDVLAHPDDGVKTRYQRMGMSVGQGSRLKERLVKHGWLESQTIPLGRTRKVLLRPGKSARERLGLSRSAHTGTYRRESLAHEYWKREWARRLAAEGYRVQLEAPRVGGRVDVLAVKGAERLGVEIETGMSNIVDNVKNCLRSGFSKIIVVATNQDALQKVESGLAGAGLLITGRVDAHTTSPKQTEH